jgi:hypothetical protein
MRVPARKRIKDLFEGLLGRDVTVGDAAPVALNARPRPTAAVYVDDTHQLSSVVLMDFPLTAWVGAALALLPKGGVEDVIEGSGLPRILVENAAELLDVLAAPLAEASGVHQRLYQTFGPDRLPPSDVVARSAQLGAREDVALGIHGYGSGNLSVVSALDLGNLSRPRQNPGKTAPDIPV